MTALLAFFLSPIGRWVAIGGISALLVAGAYSKGRWDGRSAYKEKIERQISEAIARGDQGRADALRKFDEDNLPEGWFRD